MNLIDQANLDGRFKKNPAEEPGFFPWGSYKTATTIQPSHSHILRFFHHQISSPFISVVSVSKFCCLDQTFAKAFRKRSRLFGTAVLGSSLPSNSSDI